MTSEIPPTNAKPSSDQTEADTENGERQTDREERQREMRAELVEANGGAELTIVQELDAVVPPIIFPLLNALLKRYFA